jgi:hypothetical protein
MKRADPEALARSLFCGNPEPQKLTRGICSSPQPVVFLCSAAESACSRAWTRAAWP